MPVLLTPLYSVKVLRDLITRIKVERGMNQKQIASHLGCTEVSLQQKIGTGGKRNKPPEDLKVNEVFALADLLGMDYTELVAMIYPDRRPSRPISVEAKRKIEEIKAKINELSTLLPPEE